MRLLAKGSILQRYALGMSLVITVNLAKLQNESLKRISYIKRVMQFER